MSIATNEDKIIQHDGGGPTGEVSRGGGGGIGWLGNTR